MDKRWDWLVLVALVGLLTGVKASLWSLDSPSRPNEADERVYLTLADRLGEHPPRYDLMGSHVLHDLSATVYDRPLFFHPPLFPALVHVSGATMLVPWLANAVTIWLIWWLGGRWYDRRRAWLAVVLYAACPVAFLCGCRLWIDGLLTMLMTLAVAAMVWCLERDSDRWFALPGTVLGLAALAKLPGLLAVVPLLVLWSGSGRTLRWQQAAWLAGPVVLLVMPWLATVWHVYHSLALAESRIPDAELSRFPFIMMARQRPFWFYVGGLLLVAPVHVFSMWGTVSNPGGRPQAVAVAWAWSVLIALTVFSLSNTFQFRYIAPALPALCLLGADRLSRLPQGVLVPVACLLVYGLAGGVLVGLVHRELGDVVPIIGPIVPGLF